MGPGNDFVDLTDVIASENINVATASGDDDVGTFVAIAGKNLKVNLGSGNDNLFMGDFSAAGDGRTVTLVSGSGDDVVSVFDRVEGKAKIRTGGGDDTVVVVAGFTDRVDVNLGGGDDELTYDGCTFEDDVKLNGAGDTDTLEDGGSNTILGDFKVKNFEIFVP